MDEVSRGSGRRLALGSAIEVIQVKEGRRSLSYPATVSYDDGNHIVVCAPFTLPRVDLGPVCFERGDRFVEHYWGDRWWGIFQVSDSAGALKGWYCNISHPVELEFEPARLLSRDLYLDLWIASDRRTIVRLDEDEFEASGIRQREPETALAACEALVELERIAEHGLEQLLQDSQLAASAT